jgi:hypothetical protein
VPFVIYPVALGRVEYLGWSAVLKSYVAVTFPFASPHPGTPRLLRGDDVDQELLFTHRPLLDAAREWVTPLDLFRS